MHHLILRLTGALLLGASALSQAAIVYTQQTDFEAALDGSFTLINLDAPPYSTALNTNDLTALTPGATFFGPNATVLDGQNFQTDLNRDRIILNGAGFNGGITPSVGMNFDSAVDGVGGWTNQIDGGRVQLFDGLNGTGNLIAEITIGGNNPNFGGITSELDILSVIFTCDFNFDLRCGLFDLQFGTFASGPVDPPPPPPPPNPVPAPGALALLGFGLISLRALRRRRSI